MKEPRAAQVVCVGVITLDALALVDRYPGADERVLADTITFAGGGPAATAAVVLARQGVDVALVGRVGDDAAGEQALASLTAEGVRVDSVQVDPNVPTQTACVVVSKEPATRAISTLKLPPLGEFNGAARDVIRQARWLHTDQFGFAPALRAKRATGSEALVSVDAGHPVPGLDFSAIDLFVPTMESLLTTTGKTGPDEAAAMVLQHGVQAVVATDGAKGASAWWTDGCAFGVSPASGTTSAPAAQGVPILSTLGAGDVFHGALLAALCRGEDWPTALASANATATLSCRALDGRSAIPSLDELRASLVGSSNPDAQEAS